MNLEIVQALIADEMLRVDQLIRTRLQSNVALINQLGQYIVSSGGKRMRPAIVLLSSLACNSTGNDHIHLATIVEFIHTATLLHDDVVDASDLRRGRQTANSIWGNEASVLVGDFLYSRAFELMVDVGNMRVMEILAHTTNIIAEGEVMQLLACRNPDATEQDYLNIIRSKTAKLFEAAAQLGAIINNRSPIEEQALAEYGLRLGTAFQLIDDVLDYSACTEEIGKNVGDDLAEGKPTLPLIYALRTGDHEQAKAIRYAIEHGGREEIEVVTKAIESTGAIAYTAALARDEARKAIEALTHISASPYKTALQNLAHFSVNRNY